MLRVDLLPDTLQARHAVFLLSADLGYWISSHRSQNSNFECRTSNLKSRISDLESRICPLSRAFCDSSLYVWTYASGVCPIWSPALYDFWSLWEFKKNIFLIFLGPHAVLVQGCCPFTSELMTTRPTVELLVGNGTVQFKPTECGR